MKVYMNEKVQLTETMSLLYVQNNDIPPCPPTARCIAPHKVRIPVVNICLASSCGCSLEACISEQTTLVEYYDNEWYIRVGEFMLILHNVKFGHDNIGEYLEFKYLIDSM